MTERETFAARWNRRKLEAKQQQGAEARMPAAPVTPEGAALGDKDPTDDTPLPTLADITPEGDIAAFLHNRVPAELCKLALRKAWETDPIISKFVEVAENQYDWNVPGGCPGFGPLDPSWDIEKLLAQATGAIPAEEPEQLAEVCADGAAPAACDSLPQSEAVLAADGTHSGAAAQDDLTADGLQGQHLKPVTAVSPTVLVEGGSDPGAAKVDMFEKTQRLAMHNGPLAYRRRHGGALPPV